MDEKKPPADESRHGIWNYRWEAGICIIPKILLLLVDLLGEMHAQKICKIMDMALKSMRS
jgi:hypothetical protein